MPKKTSTNTKLLPIREAARILKLHPETLRRWDNQGKLQAVRVGTRQDRKYRATDIVKVLEKMR